MLDDIAVEKTRFSVDGRDYVFAFSDLGRVEFALLTRWTRSADGLFPIGPERFDDRDTGANALRVFGRVAQLTVEAAKRRRPGMVFFHPSNDRRIAIYDWLCRRLRARLPEYHYYLLGGTFYFFRRH